MSLKNYEEKLLQELEIYKNVNNIHELPDIFHYWSNKYLAPMIRSYGFKDINAIYVHYMCEACCRQTDKTNRFISIGAGNCELEVELTTRLFKKGITNFTFNCLEINPEMLERGKKLASENSVQGLMNFIPVDINQWVAQDSYDIIIASQSLHHFVELEAIFDQIYEILSPAGYFITHDMIGRNGHMRWPEALELVQQFWAELPERYKYNHQLSRLELEFMDWDCSVDGFEGIRAQDILPLLTQKFYFEFFVCWGGVIDVFVDRGFGHNFDPDINHDRLFIDKVQILNFEKILAGVIKPTQMIAAMRKANVVRQFFWYGLSPDFCLRKTS